MMKRLLTLLIVVLCMASCQTRTFKELPSEGNRLPVLPLRLHTGVNQVQLADCLPEWDGADSVTARSERLRVWPLADGWSRFGVMSAAATLVDALDVWQHGRKLSVPVLIGRTDDSVRMFSDGAMLKVVSVRCNREPSRVVALWQNCLLPESSIVEIDGAFGVIVPKDAKDMDRSWLRVYAATDSALFNDVLIPLRRGRIIRSARQLTPCDRQAQVLYALMLDRFENGDPSNDPQPVSVAPDLPGGDLQGLADRLRAGFFDSLHVTAIRLETFRRNCSRYGEPAHADSCRHDNRHVAPVGCDYPCNYPCDGLRDLLAAAHKRGIHVISDRAFGPLDASAGCDSLSVHDGRTCDSCVLSGGYLLFDDLLHRTMVEVLLRDDSIGRIARAVSASCAVAGAHHTLVNRTGDRHKPRFISLAGGAQAGGTDDRKGGCARNRDADETVGYRKLALLEAILMTVPGVPCILQGDEYGQGGTDPSGHGGMMRFDGYTPAEKAHRATVVRLAALRRTRMPLMYGDLIPLHCDHHTWSFARIYMGQYAVAAFNNGPKRRDLLVELPEGLKTHPLKSNFGGEIRQSPDGRRVAIVLPPYGFEVLTKAD